MGFARRTVVVVLLATFVVSVFTLWIHDHVGHGAAAPPCAEAPGHFCTGEGHHRVVPCIFCSLRVCGQELSGDRELDLPFLTVAPCRIPDGTPVFDVFLPFTPQRGPPAA